MLAYPERMRYDPRTKRSTTLAGPEQLVFSVALSPE